LEWLPPGQQQRVSIARSILHNPPVMFMDEPTAGLDVVTSRIIMQFIDDSRRRGHTILFSTHIMSEAERLCDRIAFIYCRGSRQPSGCHPSVRTGDDSAQLLSGQSASPTSPSICSRNRGMGGKPAFR